ncbi:Ubiquinol-cytochrome c reductase core protein II [Operophtera brumata]|uniref:Ubiquinol-cytochrome c reductase core protein II n=1 Tax=Operophtera brumata TaxID=104452 RepID=A0A0L7LCS5_OPEBR|nr:Ubiquinol-cytochrome c reductase core protein II [Operophtera brumata]
MRNVSHVTAALGNGPVTKWGSDNSPVAQAVGNIGPFAAAGFNVSYTDNGLFGVVLSVPKDEANTALSKARCSKISIGAAGNLAFVPYADEV